MPSNSRPAARISRIKRNNSSGEISYDVAGSLAAFVAGSACVMIPSRPASSPQTSCDASWRDRISSWDNNELTMRIRAVTVRVYTGLHSARGEQHDCANQAKREHPDKTSDIPTMKLVVGKLSPKLGEQFVAKGKAVFRG